MDFFNSNLGKISVCLIGLLRTFICKVNKKIHYLPNLEFSAAEENDLLSILPANNILTHDPVIANVIIPVFLLLMRETGIRRNRG